MDFPRDASVTGMPKPGEDLQETTVAEQVSGSRSSVREAFRQLDARSDPDLFHKCFQALEECQRASILIMQALRQVT